MTENEKDKLNTVDSLKKRIFNRGYRTLVEHRKGFTKKIKNTVPDSWDRMHVPQKTKKVFMKTSIFKKFFLFSLAFFVVALGYVAFMFYGGGNTVSNENIEINVLGNSFVDGGENLPLVIEIVNKNTADLNLVDLVVEYPKGTSSGSFEDVERLRSSLGTIKSGDVIKENVDVVLFGEQGSVHEVKISLEYRLEGSNAIFLKEKGHKVTVDSTPLELVLDAPLDVTPNQEITLNIKTLLNSTKPVGDVLVKVDYPLGFSFTSASPAPSFGDDVWSLGDIPAGGEREIVIKGKMVDVYDGEEKTFHVFSGSESELDRSEIGIVFNSLGHTLSISKPFIEANLLVNSIDDEEYAIDSKSIIRGSIRWVNNLATKVNDLEIVVKISGNAYDEKTISSKEGFYNSSLGQIVWDKNTSEGFDEVSPGDTGTVSFTVSPLSLYSASGGLLSDPTVNIQVSISGRQSSVGNVLTELKNSETKTVKVVTDVGFLAKALHYSGPIDNDGTIPPKVNQVTQYTIGWSLSNTSNSASSVKVKGTLPAWVNFAGVFTPGSEDVSYDEDTRQIVWNVGTLSEGTGILSDKKEVYFQVNLTPSLSQVGKSPVLIKEVSLSGEDDFTGVKIGATKSSLDTKITSDPLFVRGSEVIE